MTENYVFPISERQPNPLPPAIPVTEAPSIFFYAGLIVIAVLLIFFAFDMGGPDWPGLLINLASGIIGAVIILIFVDRRLRTSELRTLQQYAETTKVRLTSVFSSDIRSSLQYAKVFHSQLIEIQQKYYVSIPAIEAIPAQHPEGFFLIGLSGSGKSTLLQRIAIENAERVIRQPKMARIPIFLPAILLNNEDDIILCCLREVRKYYLVKRNIFEKWLTAGRITILIDGINENINPKLLLKKIVDLRRNYPKIIIIASARDILMTELSLEIYETGLPIIKMPSPSEEEIERIIRIRKSSMDRY